MIALGVHSEIMQFIPLSTGIYSALSTAFSIGNWDSERVKFELPYIDGINLHPKGRSKIV